MTVWSLRHAFERRGKHQTPKAHATQPLLQMVLVESTIPRGIEGRAQSTERGEGDGCNGPPPPPEKHMDWIMPPFP